MTHKRIAKFMKVSYQEFKAGIQSELKGLPEKEIQSMYDDLPLPRRATSGSAGYDFFAPFSFHLQAGESIRIPTGIRARMEEEWVLQLFPRSGLGFKYRLQLDNTVGIIDSDYFFSDNEGHIICKITNNSMDGKDLLVSKGSGFVQGIFLPFGITEDDDADGIRNGGFGSTSKE